MIISLMAFAAALVGAPDAPASTSPASSTPSSREATLEARTIAAAALVNRESARIPFTSNLDNFRVEYEDHEDILYLSTGFGKWYRAPLHCFGMGDARDAMRIIPIDHGMGIDKFTRFRLFSMGGSRQSNECTIANLVELTPQETVVFGLESQRRVNERLARRANSQ